MTQVQGSHGVGVEGYKKVEVKKQEPKKENEALLNFGDSAKVDKNQEPKSGSIVEGEDPFAYLVDMYNEQLAQILEEAAPNAFTKPDDADVSNLPEA